MQSYGIKRWLVACTFLYAFISSMTVQAESQKEEKELTVSSGKEVSIEYTLKLEDNAVIDTNVGSKAFSYVHGSNQIIPGLQKALEGMKVGDSKQVTVKPEEGYGNVNQEAISEVNKEQIPQDALKIGVQIQGQDASGRVVHALVVEIKENTVVLDFNHPLAGKTLYFDVKVLNIREEPTS
ncbi:MAG: peptidylprolyl isomerase [Candidatus Scalinduaceae bacterium]